MQIVLRFEVQKRLKEKIVTVSNARSYYRKLKRKYFLVDLILIEDNGIEHCIA